MTPEFSRPVSAERLGPAGLDITVEATPDECAALADRLKLPGVATLSCRFRLRPGPGEIIAVEGWLTALVTQTCVVSLDDFEAVVTDHFTVSFVPAGTESDDIDPETEDEIPYANGMIDLGEAATEQLALSLDPWPRKPDATLPQPDDAEPSSPFAALVRPRRPS
jgi:uncharacterized metal-binding protein YceD (DUF177 family)